MPTLQTGGPPWSKLINRLGSIACMTLVPSVPSAASSASTASLFTGRVVSGTLNDVRTVVEPSGWRVTCCSTSTGFFFEKNGRKAMTTLTRSQLVLRRNSSASPRAEDAALLT